MRKSVIGLFLIACIVCICALTFSESAFADGTYENITWTLDESGLLTISGTGAMPDFSYSYTTDITNIPWYTNHSEIQSAYISDGITTIGSNAFYGCENLGSVRIPNSITSVGYQSFYSCSSLTKIFLPSTVNFIGAYAFAYDGKLEEANIPDGITSIPSGTFERCGSLKAISIPEGVTSIGGFAISGCTSLTEIVLPSTLVSLEWYAFYGDSGITSITLPQRVTSIGKSVFDACTKLENIYVNEDNAVFSSVSGVLFNKDQTKIIYYPKARTSTSYTIPNSVLYIGENAFYECNNLETIILPEGLLEIGNSAFFSCYALEMENFPSSLSLIGPSAFTNCRNIKTIEINENTKKISSGAFSCTGITSVSFAEGIETIESYAFQYCNGLTEVTLPMSVVYLGESVFDSSVTINCYHNSPCDIWATANGNTINYIGEYVPPEPTGEIVASGTFDNITWSLNDAGLLTISGNGQMPNWSYSYPTDETNIPWAGYRDRITSALITDGLTTIGSNVFYGCNRLATVTIPSNITSVGYQSFYSCSSLTEVELPDTVSEIQAYAFAYDGALQTVNIPSGITSIPSGTFEGCYSLESINIPEGVTYIGGFAISSCRNLDEIILPSTLETLDWYAFYDCTGIQSVIVPDNVTHIGKNTFAGCSNLQDATLPYNIEYLGDDAFDNTVRIYCHHNSLAETWALENSNPLEYVCELKTSVLPASSSADGQISRGKCLVCGYSDSGIQTIHSDKVLNLPANLVTIETDSFHGIAAEQITVPMNVSSVSGFAFSNCSNLLLLYVQSSATAFESKAVSECSNITILCHRGSLAEQYAMSEEIPYLIIEDSITP